MSRTCGIPPEGLEAAIAGLPAIEQQVLRLCAGEGLAYEAIAAQLGLPVAAVERHLADALCRLDRILSSADGDHVGGPD